MALGKSAKSVLGVMGIIFGLLGLFYVHVFVYPFTVASPNFSDVERVFSKIQFPADWQEVSSSQNSGLHGRGCPIEGSGCFHKSKTFKVPESLTVEEVKAVMMQVGCDSVAISDNTYKDDIKESKNLECSIDALNISGAQRGPEAEVYVAVGT